MCEINIVGNICNVVVFFYKHTDPRAAGMSEYEVLEQVKRRLHEKAYMKELLAAFGITNFRGSPGITNM